MTMDQGEREVMVQKVDLVANRCNFCISTFIRGVNDRKVDLEVARCHFKPQTIGFFFHPFFSGLDFELIIA